MKTFDKVHEREGVIQDLPQQSLVSSQETFRVTFVDDSVVNVPTIHTKGKEIPLIEGVILETYDYIETKDGKVEIKGHTGLRFRLGDNSTFVLEPTEIGVIPVFHGKVFKGRFGGIPITMCGGKYRTSCYVQCPPTIFAKSIETNLDTFYSIGDNLEIWEYDERGKKFPIVNIEEGYKVALRFHEGKQMRERYEVDTIEEIKDEEYDNITSNYMNPKNWK